MTELIGQVFGDYRIEAVGAAQDGVQQLVARHVRLDRPVALLLLDAARSAEPAVQARFLPVIQATAALQHPHIAEIYDFNQQQGRFYIAEELLRGGTLRGLVQRRAASGQVLPLAQTLGLLRQAAEALSYAHGRGVVHGDLRPELLLLAGTPAAEAGLDTLKVSGFGLGPLLGQRAAAYAAPELLPGGTPDARSDVYAFGCLLYELALGQPPTRQPDGSIALPLVPQLPEALAALIRRCLAPRPAERPADGTALLAALDQLPPLVSPATTVIASPPPASPAATVTAAPPQEAAPRLRLLDAAGQLLQSLPLTGSVTLGRSPDSPLALDGEQISRQHVRIEWDGRQVLISDLGSTNGTLLDGQRLPPQTPRVWPWASTVQLGRFRLQLDPPLSPTAATVVGVDPLLATLLAGPSPVAATAAVGGERLSIRLDQEQLTIEPGQPTFLPLTVINRSDTPDLATLSVEGLPDAWFSLPDAPLRLAPGGQATVNLTITVPRESASPAGTYPVVLRARSSASPGASGTALARWRLLAFHDSRVALTPRRVDARRGAAYQVFIANEGNAPADYQLSALDNGEPMRFTFGQDRVSLQPGEEITIGLAVAAPRPLFGADAVRPFQIQINSASETPHVLEASLAQSPQIPLWLPLLIVALLLGALLLRTLWGQPPTTVGSLTPLPTLVLARPSPTPSPTPSPEPGAPEIALFQAQPNVVAPGQPLVVSWDVRNAERVVIEQFGDVPPQGSREHRVDQTTDYRLTAYGGGKQTERIERVFVVTPTVAAPSPVPPTAAAPTPEQPTAVPPTALLPTAIPPTAIPPTELPTAIPPTQAPTPVPTPINLQDQAAQATWASDGGALRFGDVQPEPTSGAQVGYTSAITLADGRSYSSTLFTLPPTSTTGFVEGQFNLPTIQAGQVLQAGLGFARDTPADTALRVQVSFSGEVIADQTIQVANALSPLNIDLAPYVGRSGQLTLRVASLADKRRATLYWVRPRIAVAGQ